MQIWTLESVSVLCLKHLQVASVLGVGSPLSGMNRQHETLEHCDSQWSPLILDNGHLGGHYQLIPW